MIERSKAKPKQSANYFRQSIGNCSMLTYVLKTASKNISFAKKLFTSPMKFALAAVTLRTAQLPVKAWQITLLLIRGEYISECRYTCMEVSNSNFLEFFGFFFPELSVSNTISGNIICLCCPFRSQLKSFRCLDIVLLTYTLTLYC